MTSTIFFFIFIPILTTILLSVNFIFAPSKPNKEKKTPFECGYHSFTDQNRNATTVSHFLILIVFLVFDLELVLFYPFTQSSFFNGYAGLLIIALFAAIVSAGFIFELGKNALSIESRQNKHFIYKNEITSIKTTGEKDLIFRPSSIGLLTLTSGLVAASVYLGDLYSNGVVSTAYLKEMEFLADFSLDLKSEIFAYPELKENLVVCADNITNVKPQASLMSNYTKFNMTLPHFKVINSLGWLEQAKYKTALMDPNLSCLTRSYPVRNYDSLAMLSSKVQVCIILALPLYYNIIRQLWPILWFYCQAWLLPVFSLNFLLWLFEHMLELFLELMAICFNWLGPYWERIKPLLYILISYITNSFTRLSTFIHSLMVKIINIMEAKVSKRAVKQVIIGKKSIDKWLAIAIRSKSDSYSSDLFWLHHSLTRVANSLGELERVYGRNLEILRDENGVSMSQHIATLSQMLDSLNDILDDLGDIDLNLMDNTQSTSDLDINLLRDRLTSIRETFPTWLTALDEIIHFFQDSVITPLEPAIQRSANVVYLRTFLENLFDALTELGFELQETQNRWSRNN